MFDTQMFGYCCFLDPAQAAIHVQVLLLTQQQIYESDCRDRSLRASWQPDLLTAEAEAKETPDQRDTKANRTHIK